MVSVQNIVIVTGATHQLLVVTLVYNYPIVDDYDPLDIMNNI